VILLRRQLASERPRRKPWLRLRIGAGVRTSSRKAVESANGSRGFAFANPVWRRDWQSFLRWPVVRVVRVVLIAVAAGGLAVGGFDLTPVLFALPGPLLFIAALDLIEPLAQESDHPSRRLLLPRHSAELLRGHLVAPAVAMAAVLALATIAAAAIGGNPGLALGVGAVAFLPLAVVLVCAAALSATNDPYEFALNPQVSQMVTLAPLVVTLIAGFLPLFVAWKVEGGDGARISGVLGIDFVLIFFALVGFAALAFRFQKREGEAQ
jgi:hypothetical protein